MSWNAAGNVLWNNGLKMSRVEYEQLENENVGTGFTINECWYFKTLEHTDFYFFNLSPRYSALI